MPIEPEDKNWTWVLERACPDCGFDASATPRGEIGERSRAVADSWPDLLAHPKARVRPDDSTWSAVEYGCHVRDVYRLGLHRLQRMLTEDDPRFANWDQDATAIEDRYDEQDPDTVAAEIVVAGAALADAYDRVTDEQWSRPGLRSDGAPFTVESFGRYFLHDPLHHVVDVRRGNSRLGGEAPAAT